MTAKDKIIVPGAENFVEQHKEEIAAEFGTHASPVSRDAVTPKILRDHKPDKDEDRTNEDMV